jgi:hypothetical protein
VNGHMKELISRLDSLIADVEGIEPRTDCEAYVRRELLSALDKAHELLNSLAKDKEN